MSEVLAIIPARGGSKGVPKKNLAPLGGLPLIAHTILAAKMATSVGRIIVSTDSEEIAEVSRAHGAEVPFLRPAELARDDTPTIPVLVHLLSWLADQGALPEYMVLLQATSPFRTATDIDAALELARAKNADAVVSVTPAEQHPTWMKRMDSSGVLAPYDPNAPPATRRQDLPPAFALNGAIYVARPSLLIEQKTWYTERTFGYVMPAERSLDIDTPWSLALANLIVDARVVRGISG